MPEIKHNFTTGKMNKDLDERLVPNGEHRDAMNIQISNSDGSDVGTVQNLLGNSAVVDIPFITQDAVCIATIASERNDSIYWFVHDVGKDFILKYSKNENALIPVFVDNFVNNGYRVLKFTNKKITGVNIIDDLMAWTDSATEPKKININRCIEGTDASGLVHTRLVVKGVDTRGIQEKDIIVIKPAPKAPLELEYSRIRDLNKMHTGVILISENDGIINSFIDSSRGIIHDFSSLQVGDYFSTVIDTDINNTNEFNLSWQEGTKVVLKEFSENDIAPSIPISNFSIKGFITDWPYNEFTNQTLDVSDRDNQAHQFSGADGWQELEDDVYEADGVSTNYKYYLPANQSLTQGRQYKIKYTIEQNTDSDPFQGRLVVRLFDVDNKYIDIQEHGERDPSDPIGINLGATVAGDYEVVLDNINFWDTFTPNTTWSGNNYASVVMFEAKNDWNVSNSNYSTGDPFNGVVRDVTIERIDATVAKVEIEITAIDGTPKAVTSGNSTLRYAIDAYVEEEGVFETKFPRFSYRYKFEDGEYSPFAPFTPVAFLPGNYRYNSVVGYNLAMTNTVDFIKLKNINNQKPNDVVAIDILYKEDGSTTVYLVDTLKNNENTYKVESEVISGAIASNQSLRLWDNVPRTANSQEIIGNRLVYGNYKQNYNLINSENNLDYSLDLKAKVISTQHSTNQGLPSVKSLREYQLGVVYTDQYGRETPVLTSSDANIRLEKTASDDINEIVVRVNNFGHPINMDYFKFYIKDNGGEYYNLPMDRYYDGRDGNIWLAFPSVDRNKIEIDDFIILKKGVDDNSLIKEQAKYKVIDIKNEAPDYIKINEVLTSSKRHADSSLLFDKIPIEGDDNFTVDKSRYTQHLSSLNNTFNNSSSESEWYVSLSNNSTNLVSKKYKIQNWGVSTSNWSIQIEGVFGEELGDFANSTDNPTEITNNTRLNIYRNTVENSPNFDGRFFVKIFRDDTFNRVVEPAVGEGNIQYTPANIASGSSRKMYYLKSDDGSTSNAMINHGGASGLNHKMFNDYDTFSTPGDFTMGRTSTKPNDDGGNLEDWVDARIACINEVGDHEYDAGTKFLNVQLAWHGWFRGLNTESDQRYTVGVDSSSFGRIDQIDLETNRTDAHFEDVWFIDSIRATDFKTYNAFNGFAVSSTSPVASPQDNTVGGSDFEGEGSNVTNYSSSSIIEIGFGGIEPEAWPLDKSWPKSFPNWYDIEDGNANYATTQGGFASSFREGNQFRFREDPTNTVYTILNVEKYQKITYDHIQEDGTQNPPTNINHYKGQVDAVLGDQSVCDINGKKYRASSFFDASNFTISYRMTLDKVVAWNPVESHDQPITGGSSIELLGNAAAPTVVSSTGGTISIEVNTITGIDSATNESTQVVPGMVLQSFDNNGSGGTNTDFSKTGVVTRIDFNDSTGVHTIFLRAANGVDKSLDNNYDAIAADDDLHFVQLSMNGLSPNSAKNLNFFQDAGESQSICGNAPIGYTFEFVEPSNVRPQDQVLPTNPAIWETEPKEKTDLDLYYEASKSYPIVVEKERLGEIIPIGSTIEHFNSNIVPDGTTITAIDSNGEITLSNEVLVDRQNLPQTEPLFDAF